MSASTPSAAALVSSAVAEFASAVRAALSDLGPDEIDDLTDGLEADLTDHLADADAGELGDPGAYAEELRGAAGLPHRASASVVRPTPWRGVIDALRRTPDEVAATFREFAAEHPSLGRLRDFLVSLRPLWWLFRAAVVAALVINVVTPGWGLPITGVTIAVGIAAIVLSVQFGRGKWLPFAWMRGLLLVLNIILVVAAPFIVAGTAMAINNGWYSQMNADGSSSDLSGSGLLENGNRVSNIFAYDAQGNPLAGVQLYDQDGQPLSLQGDPGAGFDAISENSILVPSDAVSGRAGWNVVPLEHVDQSAIADDGTSIKDSATRIPADPPLVRVMPLATSHPTPSP